MKIENRMRQVMEKQGVTEEALAELVGLSQAQINRLKNHKRIPRLDVAFTIAKALKVKLETLWSLSDRSAA